MEKLGQLHADARRPGGWDLIVVDTPPSRSALDFLDAPERLSSFLDGRFIRLLLAPGPGPGQADDGRPRRGDQRADQDPRRPGAARHADVRGGLRHAVRRVPAARARRPSSCSRPTVRRSWWSPRRSRTRCARRPTSWSGSTRSGCRWPGWWSTGPAARRGGTALRRAGAGRRRAARGGRQPATGPDRGTAAAARRPAPASWRARHGCARGSRRRTRTCRRPSCRHCPPTCTTSTAFGWSATFSPGGPDRCARVRGPGRLSGSCEALRPATSSGRDDGRHAAAWSTIAVSSRRRHEVTFGRRRSSARRSRSVMPPQTPHSIWLSSASARHSVRTGHPAHICLARFCAAPRTNSSSGRVWLHSALTGPVFVPHRALVPSEKGPPPSGPSESIPT